MNTSLQRFPIRFETLYGLVSTAVLLPPAHASVDIDDDLVHVRMGWAFQATFPRTSIVAAAPAPNVLLTRGVHGFGGRWLVNGAGTGLVRLELAPSSRARVLGVRVSLRELVMSVEDPSALLDELAGDRRAPRAA